MKNWQQQFDEEFVMFNGQYIEPQFRDKSDVTPVKKFITTLLEKQREEIQDKLNKHWDKLESNDYDFKDMDDWRIFKCIRNNNNDVINDKTS